MTTLRRLVLVRHGETEGQSSIRYFGSTDVDLSAEGRAQMREVAGHLSSWPTDIVVASPLQRSWKSAAIAGRGSQVRLYHAFREVDFGRWEGFTADEIRDTDPTRYAEWQEGADTFAYPSGEARPAFKARVVAGLNELLQERATSALLVLHKGVIRVIVEELLGEALPEGAPELGEVTTISRRDDGWAAGTPSSDPEGLAALAGA